MPGQLCFDLLLQGALLKNGQPVTLNPKPNVTNYICFHFLVHYPRITHYDPNTTPKGINCFGKVNSPEYTCIYIYVYINNRPKPST